MALLIRNGEIVTVGSRVQADIYVENETITRIGNNLALGQPIFAMADLNNPILQPWARGCEKS